MAIKNFYRNIKYQAGNNVKFIISEMPTKLNKYAKKLKKKNRNHDRQNNQWVKIDANARIRKPI